MTRHALDTRLWRARKSLREALKEHAHEYQRISKEYPQMRTLIISAYLHPVESSLTIFLRRIWTLREN